MQKYLYKLPK